MPPSYRRIDWHRSCLCLTPNYHRSTCFRVLASCSTLLAPVIDGSHALGGISSCGERRSGESMSTGCHRQATGEVWCREYGAVGTFVVREDVSESTLRAAF